MPHLLGEGAISRHRPSRRLSASVLAVSLAVGGGYVGWRLTNEPLTGPVRLSGSLDCTKPGLSNNLFEAVMSRPEGEVTIDTPNEDILPGAGQQEIVNKGAVIQVVSHAGKLAVTGVAGLRPYKPGDWVESTTTTNGVYDVFAGLPNVIDHGTVVWRSPASVTVVCDEYPLPGTPEQNTGVNVNLQETPSP